MATLAEILSSKLPSVQTGRIDLSNRASQESYTKDSLVKLLGVLAYKAPVKIQKNK